MRQGTPADLSCKTNPTDCSQARVRKFKETNVSAVNVLLRGALAGQRHGSALAAPERHLEVNEKLINFNMTSGIEHGERSMASFVLHPLSDLTPCGVQSGNTT